MTYVCRLIYKMIKIVFITSDIFIDWECETQEVFDQPSMKQKNINKIIKFRFEFRQKHN